LFQITSQLLSFFQVFWLGYYGLKLAPYTSGSMNFRNNSPWSR
jgi:hypothetical protein